MPHCSRALFDYDLALPYKTYYVTCGKSAIYVLSVLVCAHTDFAPLVFIIRPGRLHRLNYHNVPPARDFVRRVSPETELCWSRNAPPGKRRTSLSARMAKSTAYDSKIGIVGVSLGFVFLYIFIVTADDSDSLKITIVIEALSTFADLVGRLNKQYFPRTCILKK